MQHDRNEPVENLTLALLYLTSWREHKDSALRSWKSYDWDATDRLLETDLIFGNRGSLSTIERHILLAKYGDLSHID